nr:rhodanese-like domain-containing protein [Saprospiraceae bacterium]
MIKYTLIFLISCLLISCSGESESSSPKAGMDTGSNNPANIEREMESGDSETNGQTLELTIDEFKRDINTLDDVVLIDVRTPVEWENGRIPGSVFMNIYRDDFQSKLNSIPRDKKLYFYCASGLRSDQAMEMAKEMGFPYSAHFKGGMNLWNKKEYETVTD